MPTKDPEKKRAQRKRAKAVYKARYPEKVKAARAAKQKRWRLKYPEKAKAQKRAQKKRWRLKYPEKVRSQKHAQYLKMKENPTDSYKARRSRINKNYRLKNKIKLFAHQMVYKAVQSGVLIKGCCVVCGNQSTHGHHEDYNKPLDVVWLCALHHREHHSKKE